MRRPAPPLEVGCDKCSFTGIRFSAQLDQLIACPHCQPHKRVDRSALDTLTAAECRRSDQLLQRAVAINLVMTEHVVVELPPNLLTTDRILQRWAVNMGSGMPYTAEEFEALAQATRDETDAFTQEACKPPPLDDDTQTVIDQIIGPDPERGAPAAQLRWDPGAGHHRWLRRATRQFIPVETAGFVWQWYCKPVPCAVMASQRGLDEWRLNSLWQSVLYLIRQRFLRSDHEDLVGLVRVLP
jgi:hypothetical protein